MTDNGKCSSNNDQLKTEKTSPTQEPPAPPFRLWLTVALATLSAHFHFGFQLGVPNTAYQILTEFINDSFVDQYNVIPTSSQSTWLWAAHIGSFQVMAIVGSQIAGQLIDLIGRRRLFLVTALVSVISGIAAVVSYSTGLFQLLFLSRMGYGIVIGSGLTVCSVYTTEITPTRYRGRVSVVGSVTIRMVNVLSMIIASTSVLGTRRTWHYIYAIELAVSLIHLVGVLFILRESPTCLLRSGHREQAVDVIRHYHGAEANHTVVTQSINRELTYSTSQRLHIWQVLGNAQLRRGAMVGLTAAVVQRACGMNIAAQFSSYLLVSTGMNAKTATISSVVMGIGGLLAVVALTLVIDRYGRRLIELTSLSVVTVCNILMMIVVLLYTHTAMYWLSLVYTGLLFVFMFAFNMGVGPIGFFLSCEVVPANARTATQSTGSSLRFLVAGLCPLYFLPLYETISAYAFLTLIVPSIIMGAVLAKYMPETKGKTIPQIMDALNGKGRKKDVKENKMNMVEKPRKTEILETVTTTV